MVHTTHPKNSLFRCSSPPSPVPTYADVFLLTMTVGFRAYLRKVTAFGLIVRTTFKYSIDFLPRLFAHQSYRVLGRYDASRNSLLEIVSPPPLPLSLSLNDLELFRLNQLSPSILKTAYYHGICRAQRQIHRI